MFGGNDERDDDFHEFMGAQDEAERQSQIEEGDDFASFDPTRYSRTRQQVPLDQIREEIEYDMSPDGPTLPRGPVPPGRDVEDFDISRYTTSRSAQIRQRVEHFVENARRDGGGGAGGILSGLIALAPGARILGVSFGCFIVMLVVGCCGTLAVVAALLLRR
ncbi:MAG: hypothetical protein IT323_02215 [Anaerolineae bacterium]|nr:hypothetical protein [Anaerolineae bacterium]